MLHVDVLHDPMMRPARAAHHLHHPPADQLPFLVLGLVGEVLLEIVEVHVGEAGLPPEIHSPCLPS